MHRFYADEHGIRDGFACLEAEDARHAARVLRMQPGEAFDLLTGGERYRAVIDAVDAQGVRCRVLEHLPTTEARLRITLFQGLPKADKLDWIVQKATEIGAEAIVPVAMQRSIVQLDAKDAARKAERWQKIAREAAKQSGRCSLPTVSVPLPLRALPERLRGFDAVAVPWEEEHALSLRAFAAAHPAAQRVAIVIGPEGGIDAAEMTMMAEAGAQAVTLGPRILRTETAGLAAMSALLCLAGDLD